ncbi:hypothetical protein NDU88_001454, partial [Pleurodeles waltl]
DSQIGPGRLRRSSSHEGGSKRLDEVFSGPKVDLHGEPGSLRRLQKCCVTL